MTYFILGVFIGLIWAATAVLFAIVLSVQDTGLIDRVQAKVKPKKKAYIIPLDPLDTPEIKEADEQGTDTYIENIL